MPMLLEESALRNASVGESSRVCDHDRIATERKVPRELPEQYGGYGPLIFL